MHILHEATSTPVMPTGASTPPYLQGWQDAILGRPHAYDRAPQMPVSLVVYNAYDAGYSEGRQVRVPAETNDAPDYM